MAVNIDLPRKEIRREILEDKKNITHDVIHSLLVSSDDYSRAELTEKITDELVHIFTYKPKRKQA